MSRAIFKIVIEPLLFVRFRVDDRVVKREGRLLGDRFENDEIALGEGRARGAVAEREHSHVLLAVKQRRDHDGSGAEAVSPQLGQLRSFARSVRQTGSRFARRGR